MLKRLFRLLLTTSFLCVPLLAQELARPDLSSLPKDQQIEIAKIIQEKKDAAKTSFVSTPEKVGEWVGVGKQIAELVPVFAEKTGIAADKVLSSFSGKVLLMIVLVHFFWAKLMGAIILIFGPLLWLKIFRQLWLVKSSECIVHPNPVMRAFGFTKRLTTYKNIGLAFEEASEGATIVGVVFVLAGIVILIVPICAILFA